MKTEPQKDIVPGQLSQTTPAPASTNTIVSVPAKRPLGPWSVLRNRNYSLLFWGQLISSAGTQMQVVAVSWQVFLLAHAAIALGLIGLVQAIPRLIFSLVGGVFADIFDRRKMLLIVEITMASTSVVLALCTIFQVINLFIVYVIVLVAASVSAFEYPTRQAIIPGLVTREQVPDALSLNSAMMQLTFIIGPTIGGFSLSLLRGGNTHWFLVIFFFLVFGSFFLLVFPRFSPPKSPPGGGRALP